MRLCFEGTRGYVGLLRISSLVALRDRDGLPGASSLPYFFLLLVLVPVPLVAPLFVPFRELLSCSLVNELRTLLLLLLCLFVVLEEVFDVDD